MQVVCFLIFFGVLTRGGALIWAVMLLVIVGFALSALTAPAAINVKGKK